MPSPEEFETALLPHLPGMLRLARVLLRGSPTEAEDLVQEAALRAFGAYPRFEPGTNFRAWLFRILRNTYVDLLRRKGREAELIHLEEGDGESNPGLAEFRAQTARERAEADLESALGQLPADLRLTLLLVDAEGMRYDDVATVLHCPIGTVRSRIHRARRLLRRELLAIWQGHPRA